MNFKKILPAFTLLFALVVAFAFKPAHKANVNRTVGEIFQFTGNPGTGDEFDPLQYVDVTGSFDPSNEGDCPDSEVLCAIETEDIYTQEDAPSSQYVGQPKVDQTPLSTLITAALTAPDKAAIDGDNGIFLEAE